MYNIPANLVQFLKSGGNPQQLMSSMLKNNNNPVLQNVMNMMTNNNMSGIEAVARNLCSAKGVDPDELYKQVQDQFK